MSCSQGEEKTDTALLHLSKTLTLGIHHIRVLLVLRVTPGNPAFLVLLQLAVIDFIQFGGTVDNGYPVAHGMDDRGLPGTLEIARINLVEIEPVGLEAGIDIFDISLPFVAGRRIPPTENTIVLIAYRFVMPGKDNAHNRRIVIYAYVEKPVRKIGAQGRSLIELRQ
jgi:hypothetical protein